MPVPEILLKPDATHRPLLIGHEVYRRSRYGTRHPLSIPRVSTALDLIDVLGFVAPGQYVEGRQATLDELARFHDREYLAALQRVQATQEATELDRDRFNLGRMENPVFPEMFERPATACGSSIMAAGLLRDGGIVYNVAGGTHHGRRDRASGFCFLNDPVLAILEFLAQGLERIAYVDLDAHHGDGVQDAFYADERVFTISIHEQGRWPKTGTLEDRAGGMARNLPVPPGFHDTEMDYLIRHAVLPLLEAWQPQVLVLQGGCDALAADPLSRLELSNNGFWAAIRLLMPVAPRLLMLGGGGYNPWSVGRCWAGVWATLNDLPMPGRLSPAAESLLRSIAWRHRMAENPPDHWFTTLADPAEPPRPIRDKIRYVAEAVVS